MSLIKKKGEIESLKHEIENLKLQNTIQRIRIEELEGRIIENIYSFYVGRLADRPTLVKLLNWYSSLRSLADCNAK